MSWVLIGLGIVAGLAILNVVYALFVDSKVLERAAFKGFDARTIPRSSPEHLELVSFMKQCRAKGLTIEESAEAVARRFS